MPVRVVRHDQNLARIYASATGGLARDLARRAIRVTNQAKINATGATIRGARNPQSRGPRVDYGRLRSSIAWEIRDDGGQVFARVGTNVFYGHILEVQGVRSRTGLRFYPFLGPALSQAKG